MTKCVYFGCPYNGRNSPRNSRKSTFTFPVHNKQLMKIWLENCGNMTIEHLPPEQLKHKCICIDHFDDKYIAKKTGSRKRLFKNAVPRSFQETLANSQIQETKKAETPPSNDKDVTESPPKYVVVPNKLVIEHRALLLKKLMECIKFASREALCNGPWRFEDPSDDEDITVSIPLKSYTASKPVAIKDKISILYTNKGLLQVVRCTRCQKLVIGCVYVCVQCNTRHCPACDARGYHAHHYVLRAPLTYPQSEWELIIRTARKVLSLHEMGPLSGSDTDEGSAEGLPEEPECEPMNVETDTEEDPLGQGLEDSATAVTLAVHDDVPEVPDWRGRGGTSYNDDQPDFYSDDGSMSTNSSDTSAGTPSGFSSSDPGELTSYHEDEIKTLPTASVTMMDCNPSKGRPKETEVVKDKVNMSATESLVEKPCAPFNSPSKVLNEKTGVFSNEVNLASSSSIIEAETVSDNTSRGPDEATDDLLNKSNMLTTQSVTIMTGNQSDYPSRELEKQTGELEDDSNNMSTDDIPTNNIIEETDILVNEGNISTTDSRTAKTCDPLDCSSREQIKEAEAADRVDKSNKFTTSSATMMAHRSDCQSLEPEEQSYFSTTDSSTKRPVEESSITYNGKNISDADSLSVKDCYPAMQGEPKEETGDLLNESNMSPEYAPSVMTCSSSEFTSKKLEAQTGEIASDGHPKGAKEETGNSLNEGNMSTEYALSVTACSPSYCASLEPEDQNNRSPSFSLTLTACSPSDYHTKGAKEETDNSLNEGNMSTEYALSVTACSPSYCASLEPEDQNNRSPSFSLTLTVCSPSDYHTKGAKEETGNSFSEGNTSTEYALSVTACCPSDCASMEPEEQRNTSPSYSVTLTACNPSDNHPKRAKEETGYSLNENNTSTEYALSVTACSPSYSSSRVPEEPADDLVDKSDMSTSYSVTLTACTPSDCDQKGAKEESGVLFDSNVYAISVMPCSPSNSDSREYEEQSSVHFDDSNNLATPSVTMMDCSTSDGIPRDPQETSGFEDGSNISKANSQSVSACSTLKRLSKYPKGSNVFGRERNVSPSYSVTPIACNPSVVSCLRAGQGNTLKTSSVTARDFSRLHNSSKKPEKQTGRFLNKGKLSFMSTATTSACIPSNCYTRKPLKTYTVKREIKKWSMPQNKFLIRSYFKISRSEPNKAQVFLKMEEAFSSEFPLYKVTSKELETQYRQISSENLLSADEISQIIYDIDNR